jgi:DNA-binding NtrC family response regulator
VARVELPPLRRRRGDIAALAHVFARHLGHTARIPEAQVRTWTDLPWPGNVRELRNAVARHLTLGDLAAAAASSFASTPPSASEAGTGVLERIVASGLSFPAARQRVIDELEQRYVEKVLAEHGGNITRAAEASGIARRQLQRVRARTNR